MKTNKPLLVVLPGGAGLTCDTLSDIRTEFAGDDLLCIDPPTQSKEWSYGALLKYAVSRLPKERKLVLLGHSFGGVQAANIAVTTANVVGLICIAAPFSRAAFESIGKEFANKMTVEIDRTGKEFDERPSDESLKAWFASYGTLYFHSDRAEAGAKMLLSTSVNHKAFLGSRDEVANKEHLLAEVRNATFAKVFLLGENDELLVRATARAEAERGGFIVHEISRAAHFMAFDNPKETNLIIKDFLDQIQKTNNGSEV
jgi:pimeloyl-ACP methyl ester carboxylesterase